MNTETFLTYEWPYILSFLPSEEILEKSAKAYGALTRKRQIDKASTLLRLAFAYGFCGMSLRQTAAWAQVSHVANISDVALLKRLRSSEDWFGHLLTLKLAEEALPPSVSPTAQRIRLVDATCVSRPKSGGSDWRLHVGFDLATLSIDHVELTDFTGPETLKRFHYERGEIIIGDRGYAHRQGIHSVVKAQADYLIRLAWNNFPLRTPTGKPFDLFSALRGLDDCVPGDFPVLVAEDSKLKLPALPARLLAVRKTEAAAEKARKSVLKERTRKGRTADPHTLETAGYIFLLTSLPVHRLSAVEGLELYRFRWQIELAFKRMKSLLDLDILPAKDPSLARSILYIKILATLLVEELTESFLDFSPWGYRLVPTPTFSLAYPTCNI